MRTFLFAMLLCACTDNQAATTVTGQAVYRDAATDHGGAPQQPAAPSQSARLTIVVEGTGTLPQIDAKCATDPVGAFEAHYSSMLEMSSGGTYLASVAEGSGVLQTPSGCTIGDLQVTAITDVVIRGELAISTESCTSYCGASARADAEAQCGATASAASCRASAESTLAAHCTTTCTQQAHAIVAEVSLGVGALGHLDAKALQTAALGKLDANLTFDHMEDDSGHKL